VGDAEGAGGNDPIGLKPLQAPHEVEQQVIVGLPAPDLLEPAFRARPENEDGEAPKCLEPPAEIFGQRSDRRQTRVLVVEAGALPLPSPAQA
jgi:hypothetical protein